MTLVASVSLGWRGKVGEAFPALAGSTFTSAADTRPEPLPPPTRRLPPCGRAPSRYCTCATCERSSTSSRTTSHSSIPPGAASAMVEETYRFGFPGIVNTPGLADVYRSYGNPGGLVRAGRRPRALSPGRPGRGRRRSGPGLLLRASEDAAQRLRARHRRAGAAEARLRRSRRDHLRGRELEPCPVRAAPVKIQNLGVLGSLDEVAALYRSCDIGLVFMHTKHPSYQPLEFMASGMATVSNINPATTWLLRDGENCLLTPPLPTPTADRLVRLVEERELRRGSPAGLEEVRQYRWDDQIERMWRAMCLRDGAFAVGDPASEHAAVR